MKLSSVKIKTSDLPKDYKELADALGGLLNPFIDNLVNGFNKNITVEDNLPFEFKTIDIVVDSNGKPTSNSSIFTNLKNHKGYICVNILDVHGTGLPNTAPFLFTETSGNFVIVKKITGLTAGYTYRLVLLGIS
jgi:hypothetical protein